MPGLQFNNARSNTSTGAKPRSFYRAKDSLALYGDITPLSELLSVHPVLEELSNISSSPEEYPPGDDAVEDEDANILKQSAEYPDSDETQSDIPGHSFVTFKSETEDSLRPSTALLNNPETNIETEPIKSGIHKPEYGNYQQPRMPRGAAGHVPRKLSSHSEHYLAQARPEHEAQYPDKPASISSMSSSKRHAANRMRRSKSVSSLHSSNCCNNGCMKEDRLAEMTQRTQFLLYFFLEIYGILLFLLDIVEYFQRDY